MTGLRNEEQMITADSMADAKMTTWIKFQRYSMQVPKITLCKTKFIVYWHSFKLPMNLKLPAVDNVLNYFVIQYLNKCKAIQL